MMREASVSVAASMGSMSSVTEQNAASANELQQTLKQIYSTIGPVQQDAAQSAIAAKETAQMAARIAEGLEWAVSRFRVCGHEIGQLSAISENSVPSGLTDAPAA
jgi:methyl-accepting chemotaxis protein